MGYPQRAGIDPEPSLWGDDPNNYDMDAGELVGECTWYANGRSKSIKGSTAAPRGPVGSWPGAGQWYDAASGDWHKIYSASDVTRGDVFVYSSHVVVVESVNGGSFTVSHFNSSSHPHKSNDPGTVAFGSDYFGQTWVGAIGTGSGGGGGGGGGSEHHVDTNSNWRDEGYISSAVRAAKQEGWDPYLTNTESKEFYRYWDYETQSWSDWSEQKP